MACMHRRERVGGHPVRDFSEFVKSAVAAGAWQG
ncbi:hypothetical protein Aros01_06556 [Streptosporangium roseum]|uniref:Uncharacterized protein n=1 Tax=Streptosporangium roseum (strain ATCC 12428 / DSM 43021 / JCM 3005 / KCTC 9067 / NCIMB 10171 / NRRL 2505 / NI 9100) TaxID=479432 RepID=D2BBL6_STRRD|nr:hypothetical protein Sros_3139 [Streptosporangium roseum DSM 43021]